MNIEEWILRNLEEAAGTLLGVHVTLMVISVLASLATDTEIWRSLAAMESMLVALTLVSVLMLKRPSETAWWALGIGTAAMTCAGIYFPHAFVARPSLQAISPAGFRIAAETLPVFGWWMTCLFCWCLAWAKRNMGGNTPVPEKRVEPTPSDGGLIDLSPL